MKATYQIPRERIEESIHRTFPSIDKDIKLNLSNRLKKEIPEYVDADPWNMAKKVYLVLKDYDITEKTCTLTMHIVNGDSFDGKVIFLSFEFHKKKFPII